MTWANQNTQNGKPQVQIVAQKKAPLDVQKEKEIFLDVRPEFVDANQSLKSGQVKTMPEIFEQLLRKHQMKKISKLK